MKNTDQDQSVNEAKNSSGLATEFERQPELSAAPSWEYIETKTGAHVFAGRFVIKAHWGGVCEIEDIRSLMKLVAAAPAMQEAIRVGALRLTGLNEPGSPLGSIRDDLSAAWRLATKDPKDFTALEAIEEWENQKSVKEEQTSSIPSSESPKTSELKATPALLPCPFCDGNAMRNDELSRGVEGVVECQVCGAVNFASRWNIRTANAHEELITERDRLLQVLETRERMPLCDVHRRIDTRDGLEVNYGNGCVPCSLNERMELLDLLAPFAAPDASENTVTVLRKLADFWNTHQGDGRVVVSYPAPSANKENQ